ncbi:MAG: hypothetical protein HQK91_03595 [Nitrospirae bacterium]|nr:hypothetical protein [Nitrospirota bacterium]
MAQQCPYLFAIAIEYNTCEYTFKFINPNHRALFCNTKNGYKDCDFYLNNNCLSSGTEDLQKVSINDSDKISCIQKFGK